MFKKIILISLLNSNFILFSQEIVSYIPMDLKSNRDFFQIVNEESKETTFFVSDRKKVQAYLLDDKMQVKDSISSKRPEKKYNDIIGFSGEKSNPKLFWSNPKREELFCQYFDLSNRKITTFEFNLDLENEKFLQQFSENGNFYLLTFVKNSQFLKLYVFDNQAKLETKTLDFSTSKITNSKGDQKELSTIFKKNGVLVNNYELFFSPFIVFQKSFEIKKITFDTPTSLTESSEKIKCFVINNNIIISFDESDLSTQLLSINLSDYKTEIKDIDKPKVNTVDSEKIKSNSFVFDNKLLQVATSKYQLKFAIKDLEGKLIKEYIANDFEPISFKNSEMIRISTSGGKRILDKTEQFLSKISSFDFGVTCYKTNENYTITIGSISEVRTGGGGGFSVGTGMGGGFGPGGGFAPMHFGGYNSFGFNYFTSVSDKFNAYANRKVIYIDCKFDSSGNHLKGDVKPNSFEKIKDYLEDKDHFNSKSLFKVGNTYYLSYYNAEMSQLRIMKFIE